MEIYISIIVPVYNVEKYLERCIESILEQTFKNFELVLINDGSTDNSGKICDEYANRDNRIRVIHKKNEGVSVARNIGIETAKGKYIMFVDSDDWLDIDMVEYLYNMINQSNYDISVCRYSLYKNGKVSNRIEKEEHIEIYNNNDDIMREFVSKNKFLFSPVNKLYKKSLFIENDIRFSNYIKYSEDALLNYHIFSNINKLIYSNMSKYNYNMHSNSTVTNINEKRLDILKAMEEIYEIIKSKYPQYLDIIANNYIGASISIIIDITMENKVKQKYFILKEVKRLFNKNSYI